MRTFCKITLLAAIIFAALDCSGQVQRSSPAVTVQDNRLQALLNFKIPVVADTTSALNSGLDSLGLVVQIRSSGDWYKRDTSVPYGHKWTKIGSGSGGDCIGCSADSIRKIKIDTTGMSDTTRYLYYDKTGNTFKFRKINQADVYNGLPSVITPGSYGDASTAVIVTLNAQGIVTAISNANIVIAQSAVTHLPDSLLSKKDKTDSTAGTGYLPVHRLADTAAVLRSLLSTGFDSASSQGGGFHTQPYNDARYKRNSDSAATSPGGYVTQASRQKLSDSLNLLLAQKQAQLSSGNGTTYGANKVELGGILYKDAVITDTTQKHLYTTKMVSNVYVGKPNGVFGTVFTDNFARSSLGSNYINSSGGQTVSFPSSAYMQVSGGNASYTAYVIRKENNGFQQWVDSVVFVPQSIGGSDYGLAPSFLDTSNYTTGFICQLTGYTGGVGKIALRNYSGVQQVITTTAITYSVGDTLIFIGKRADNVFNFTWKNKTVGGADSVTLSYSIPTSPAASSLQSPGTGHFGLHFMSSGAVNIVKWTVTSSEPTGVPVVVGNSIAGGGYTANIMANSWPYLTFGGRKKFAKWGGSGDLAVDVYNNLAAIDSLHPTYVLFDPSTNDAGVTPAATYSSEVTAFVTHGISQGWVPVLVEITPSSVHPTKPFSDTMRAIAARYNVPMINGIYDALRNATGTYNPIYSDDSLHPNTAGHAVIASVVKNAVPYIFDIYNVTMPNLPIIHTSDDVILAQDGSGNAKALDPYDTLQFKSSTVHVGSQLILPNDVIPAISAKSASAGGFNMILENSDATGWSGPVIYNSAGLLRAGFGWTNSGAGGITSARDSAFIFKTYGVNGKFQFYAGNNTAFANPPELNIDSLAVILGSNTNKKNALLQNYKDTWLGGKLIIHTPSSGTTTDSVLVWRPSDSTVRMIASSLLGGGGGAPNPFADNTALVKNNADNTKLWKVSAASITTGTTRTWTVPDYDGTFAAIDHTQTFSQKQTYSVANRFNGLSNPSDLAYKIAVIDSTTGDMYWVNASAPINVYDLGSGGSQQRANMNGDSLYVRTSYTNGHADDTLSDGGINHVTGNVFNQTADGSVTNTNTTTSILGTGQGSRTIATGKLYVGQTIVVKGFGYISTDATTPTLTITFANSSSNSGNAVNSLLSSSMNNVPIEWEYSATIRTTGSSGSIQLNGWVSIGGTKAYLASTAASTFNTTTNQTFDVTALFNNASTNNTITTKQCTVSIN